MEGIVRKRGGNNKKIKDDPIKVNKKLRRTCQAQSNHESRKSSQEIAWRQKCLTQETHRGRQKENKGHVKFAWRGKKEKLGNVIHHEPDVHRKDIRFRRIAPESKIDPSS